MIFVHFNLLKFKNPARVYIGSNILVLMVLIFIWGWSGGAMVLGELPVPGRPTSLDKSRARAYCSCSRFGWGLSGHFYSHLSFLSSFSLSLGDDPIQTEILSQRVVKTQNNQPNLIFISNKTNRSSCPNSCYEALNIGMVSL